MRLFTKGRSIAGTILGKAGYNRSGFRAMDRFMLPATFLCLGTGYLLYHYHPVTYSGSGNEGSLLASLLTIGVLFFLLVRTARQKSAVEKKLKTSQFRFDKVYNAGIVGLLFTRLDGVVTQANDSFLSMIGYTADDLKNELVSWKTLTPETYQAVSARAVEQLRTQGFCEPFEKEYIRKDGSAVHVVVASALLDGDDLADAITYIIDISHRHQARLREEELSLYVLKQKEELQRLLMNAPSMISIRRGPELRLEFSNQTAQDYAGTKAHLGLTLRETADKFQVNAGAEILENVYRTGERFTAKAFKLNFNRPESDKPQEAWFDLVVEPLLNELGEIDGVATFGFNVTDMVKTNADLRESERRFRFLADSLPHKIWTCGPDGKANYYNKGWFDYLGAGTFEEVQASIWAAIHPDDLPLAKSLWTKAVATGEDLELEQRFKNAQGNYEWHLTRSYAHKNEAGEVVLWIGSSTNIQEQKTVQETADLLSRKKDEFLGIASHELKTPITSMKASLQVLNSLPDDQFKPEKVKSFVGMATRQVKKLSLIVEELLDVTRLEAGMMSLNFSVFSLRQAVEECLEEIKPAAKDRIFTVLSSGELMVNGDKLRLEQVIFNLLTNAVKYSPQGSEITISLSQDEKIRCSVSDEGIGVPAARQQLIFEKFSRGHDASQKYAGLGLGLFISRQIVRRHDGEIGLTSSPGQGTTAWFELPLIHFRQAPGI
jgi:PAS domain S-box-containing protein